MRILVIGSGAREHAIVHSLAREGRTAEHRGEIAEPHELHAAPGNPGMGTEAHLHDVVPTDPGSVAALATELEADLVVIGPEAPLVAGVADAVRSAGIPCFGPSAQAAMLEGSKAFAKEVMAAAQVPTAKAHACTSLDQIAAAMDEFGAPYVIKDDGLAAGKGVVVTSDRGAALSHAESCLEHAGAHGAPARVVVEEYLDGPEVSLFCISDGKAVVPLVPAQDFKRALDGDQGPNTGGMGAYSPLPWAPPGLVDEVVQAIAQPTIDEMARRGTPFAGVLYVGLALTSKGTRVVEFNARFGDPETQVVLARLASPLSSLLMSAARGSLTAEPSPRWRDDAAVTVVVAAHGYPGKVRSGDPITGISDAEAVPGVHVLHAGTALAASNTAGGSRQVLVSAGGRVLSIVGCGKELAEARERAYAAVDKIVLNGGHHRGDIAIRF